MSRSRSFIWCALSAIALLLAVGACGPKEDPNLPADTLTEPSTPKAPDKPVTDVDTPARPDTKDQTPDLLSTELMEADKQARDKGLIGDVYFDFDKYDLKPEARERLAKNAEFMKQYPRYVIEIQGHCDERGTNDYNVALADRRANAAREYMVTLGIAAARLKTVSFGEESPVCTDHNESCWWRNRRGEFHLSGNS